MGVTNYGLRQSENGWVCMEMLQDVAWEDLAVLLVGLEHGSLSRAARQLRISQSTASRRLVRLEERLGGRLFDRTPDGLAPTVLAFDIAPFARLIAGHMNDIARVASGFEAAPHGRVRLAVVDGLAPALVVPGLAALRSRHPGIELDLLSSPSVVDLVRGEADLALRFVRPTAPDLRVHKLQELPMGVYVHPRLAEVPYDALPWVAFYDPTERFEETRWLNAHVRPEHLTTVSAWSVLWAVAQAGMGAAILSPYVAEPAGLVRREPVAPAIPSRELLLVYHRALRDVPRIAAVRSWLVELVEGFVTPA